MDKHRADKLIAQMTIEGTYKRNGPGHGINIHSEAVRNAMHREDREHYDIVDALMDRLAVRLKVPREQWDFGIGPIEPSFRITPASSRISSEQLKQAVQAEINESKARVAGKKVSNNDITGGQEFESAQLQAGGKNSNGNYLA